MKRKVLTANERLTSADLTRAGALPRDIIQAAEAIVCDVRARGDKALREYTQRFDGFCPQNLRVAPELMEAAARQADPAVMEALTKAHQQIREFHERELEKSWQFERSDGTVLGVKVSPVASAGIYVPGGRAQYPSTVLMNAVPAKVAGVSRIAMVTPAQADGSLSVYTLAAAHLAGVDEVYAVGGAQAIAALAYGTESLAPVAKITGPGNAYVAAAKRYVSGDVGIDMVAGPSEVCVLADASADPAIIAADLMAQAEHDPLATCYLVTCELALANAVEDALQSFLVQSPRAEISARSLNERGLVVVAGNMDAALDAVDLIAPEHLELHTCDAEQLVERVHNAGAIFVGEWSSEPLGDYVAGPNHTLPTGGTAAFSSPLGTYDFQKRSSVIYYSAQGLAMDGPAVQTLAQAEGLWAHALSVGLRGQLFGRQGEPLEVAKLTEQLSSIAWPQPLIGPSSLTLED